MRAFDNFHHDQEAEDQAVARAVLAGWRIERRPHGGYLLRRPSGMLATAGLPFLSRLSAANFAIESMEGHHLNDAWEDVSVALPDAAKALPPR